MTCVDDESESDESLSCDELSESEEGEEWGEEGVLPTLLLLLCSVAASTPGMDQVTHTNESCHTNRCDMSRIRMSHVTLRSDAACHAYE